MTAIQWVNLPLVGKPKLLQLLQKEENGCATKLPIMHQQLTSVVTQMWKTTTEVFVDEMLTKYCRHSLIGVGTAIRAALIRVKRLQCGSDRSYRILAPYFSFGCARLRYSLAVACRECCETLHNLFTLRSYNSTTPSASVPCRLQ